MNLVDKKFRRSVSLVERWKQHGISIRVILTKFQITSELEVCGSISCSDVLILLKKCPSFRCGMEVYSCCYKRWTFE